MKKIRVQFLLFVYDKTQKLYRKYFKKKKDSGSSMKNNCWNFRKTPWAESLANFTGNTAFQ